MQTYTPLKICFGPSTSPGCHSAAPYTCTCYPDDAMTGAEIHLSEAAGGKHMNSLLGARRANHYTTDAHTAVHVATIPLVIQLLKHVKSCHFFIYFVLVLLLFS